MNKRMKLLVAADLVILVGCAIVAGVAEILSPRLVYLVFGTDSSTVDKYTGLLFMFGIIAPICVIAPLEAIKPNLSVRERLAGAFVALFGWTIAVGVIAMLFR